MKYLLFAIVLMLTSIFSLIFSFMTDLDFFGLVGIFIALTGLLFGIIGYSNFDQSKDKPKQ